MDYSVWIALAGLVLAAYNMSDLAWTRIKKQATAVWRVGRIVAPLLVIANSMAGLYFFYTAEGPITRLQVLTVALHTFVILGTPISLLLDRISDRVLGVKQQKLKSEQQR